MTKLEPLIKAFVKTLEEATNTSDLTSTQFECFTPECRRVMMGPLDIEPGTVICVGGWEAMRVVGNEKAWDGHTHTHEQFADTARNSNDVVHYGVI